MISARLIGAIGLGLFMLFAATQAAPAREGYADNGRPLVCDPADLGKDTPELKRCRDWISGVLQPRSVSKCCGEGDAYIADAFKTNTKGEYVAVISRDYPAWTYTDNEGNSEEIAAIEIGAEIVIPDVRLNRSFTGTDNNPIGERAAEGSNPTGHGIVFMNQNRMVYCYFAPLLAQAPATQAPGVQYASVR